MLDRPWLLFFAPVVLVAIEVVTLSVLIRRDHWEIYEVAPLGIAVAVIFAFVCSVRFSVLTTRDLDPPFVGKRVLIAAACFVGQVALSCGAGMLLFRG